MDKKLIRENIKKEALEWVGTAYHHKEAVKGVGADCGLILLKIYANLGFIDYNKVLAEIGNYSEDWAFHQNDYRYLNQILIFCNEIKDKNILTGDIILYKWGQCPSHGALVLDYPNIIHAFRPYNCVCLDDAERIFLRKKVYGVYRLKELCN
jgi:hypothetical protein